MEYFNRNLYSIFVNFLYISDYLVFWGKVAVGSNSVFHFTFNPEFHLLF